MAPDVLLGGAMLVSLVFYALLGGADYGGGVLDLLASGPRRAAQRQAIEDAIGPIWEANHVWLILVIVILFTGFPPAFAAVATALFVPLVLFLIGVVLRGSAFTFRAYDSRSDTVQRRWGLVFSIASIVAPFTLGTVVGALASGRVRLGPDLVVVSGHDAWLGPFPLAVGAFTVALFTLLAAVYLAVEAKDAALKEDFRLRAIGAAAAVGALALLTFVLSGREAPVVRRGLTALDWSLPLHLTTGGAAATAFVALFRRRYALARAAAALEVAPRAAARAAPRPRGCGRGAAPRAAPWPGSKCRPRRRSRRARRRGGAGSGWRRGPRGRSAPGSRRRRRGRAGGP